MFIVKWIVIGVVVIALGTLAAGQFGALSGTPPTDLGVRDGRLKQPSLTENSVSSQAPLYADHPQRVYATIAPLPLKGDGPATIAKLNAIVQATAGAEVVQSDPGYLYARYTSRLLKFVDDVEFWFDPASNVIQVRSASRIGRSDMGVNRKRVEAVREALAQSP